MLEKKLQHPIYGEVLLRKQRSNKKIWLKVSPPKNIIITMPYHTSWATAEQLLRDREAWLKNALDKMTQRAQEEIFLFTPGLTFSTKERTLEWIETEGSCKIRAQVDDKQIRFLYSRDLDWKSKDLQEFIRKNIEKALRLEAIKYLKPILEHYAQFFGFQISKTSFKSSKNRWGSCDIKNNINLNVHLLRLPERLLRYVILHELAHTKEHNHSQNFWALLEKICQETLGHSAKALDKELNLYSPHVFKNLEASSI